MFGFRANLSMQDVLLQLKEDVLETMPKNGENVVMALDIKGAFDNVSHAAIMEGLNNTDCGRRIHDYVKDFLTNRTASVELGEMRSDVFTTPSKGTPQGSVISPILFNVAMIGLAERLSRIQGIQHAMYADDITVWGNHRSLGEKQETIQQVANCVERYVKERGLACSTEKSELLRAGRYPTNTPLEVKLEGQYIPERNIIRVLEMWLQATTICSHTFSLLSKSAEQWNLVGNARASLGTIRKMRGVYADTDRILTGDGRVIALTASPAWTREFVRLNGGGRVTHCIDCVYGWDMQICAADK
ncbi:putative nicotine oxidoreductase [Dermacentor albipictus]|uniref:putative nicotine oxidoreductase n=1 Tax=Dermacentor albipictus TaxID=60249 RepID=UPI0038FD2536